jgi:hypothetical protein
MERMYSIDHTLRVANLEVHCLIKIKNETRLNESGRRNLEGVWIPPD